MQKQYISAVLWPNPIKHAPNTHLNTFKSFYRTFKHEESLRIFTSLAYGVSPHFTVELFHSVISPVFVHRALLPYVGEPKDLQDINNFWIAFPYVIFPLRRKFLLFCYTETPSPNYICTFNRPLCLSLNGIRAWTVLSIKTIYCLDRDSVFPHLHLLTAILKRVVHGISTAPHPFSFPWSKSRRHMNPV